MANFSLDNIKTSAKKLFSKSKTRTEEVLQITQLNQRIRAIRNEREEGIKKLGEEAYAKWLSQEFTSNILDELCEYIQEKDNQIKEIEEEKLVVRESSAQKIKEVNAMGNIVTEENDEEAMPKEETCETPEVETSEAEEVKTIIIDAPLVDEEEEQASNLKED